MALFDYLFRAAMSAGYQGKSADFAAEWSKVARGHDGRDGPMGAQGIPGIPGEPGYNPFALEVDEQMAFFEWKGVRFEAPLPRELLSELPTGKLSVQDVQFMQTFYPEVIDRIAMFWEDKYLKDTRMKRFTGAG